MSFARELPMGFLRAATTIPHDKTFSMMLHRLDMPFEFAGDFHQLRIMANPPSERRNDRNGEGHQREVLHMPLAIFASNPSPPHILSSVIAGSSAIERTAYFRHHVFHPIR